MGVGAVLSQRCPEDNKLHPCAFFSKHFTLPERNYNVGDRELLAVKLSLEEWRHRLKGTDTPVIVWTDHKKPVLSSVSKDSTPDSPVVPCFSLGSFSISLTVQEHVTTNLMDFHDSFLLTIQKKLLNLSFRPLATRQLFDNCRCFWAVATSGGPPSTRTPWISSAPGLCQRKEFPLSSCRFALTLSCLESTLVPHLTRLCHQPSSF